MSPTPEDFPHEELFPKGDDHGHVQVDEADERIKQIQARTPDMELKAWLVNEEGDVFCTLEFSPAVTLYRHFVNLIGSGLEKLMARQQNVAIHFLHQRSAQELADIKQKKALAATPADPQKSTDLN